MKNKGYTILMALELTSIGIKYGGLNNNPFQHSTPTVLLFFTAACCHVLASRAQTNWPTNFIFNVSGVVGCEALMWILIAPEVLWWTLLLVTLWFNYYQINELIRGRTHDPNWVSRASLCV
ncbi:uncharacterized protein HKW66_Vig0084450 [Vigna angularis]|uniref:Uncharacterized protein n=1 Tax=Phaseolus angularis TaxID=3914 RepID=A0A8T0KL10_PHAAN|nr:uncharacterized protein HKW66_Vig0084450 [Vigna angularis]